MVLDVSAASIINSNTCTRPRGRRRVGIAHICCGSGRVLVTKRLVRSILRRPMFCPFREEHCRYRRVASRDLVVSCGDRSCEGFCGRRCPTKAQVILFNVGGRPRPLPENTENAIGRIYSSPVIRIAFSGKHCLNLVPSMSRFTGLGSRWSSRLILQGKHYFNDILFC